MRLRLFPQMRPWPNLESFSISFPGHVTEDILLPSSGPGGSVFSWKSDDPARIDSRGHVHRPDHGQKAARVTLTLTAACKEARRTKDFPLTILPRFSHPLPRKPYLPAAPLEEAVPRPKASQVPPGRVHLAGIGIFPENQDRCLEYLRLLDTDRMLYNFRRAFGFDTKNALPPGGWEEPAGLLRGHSTGHFLSALAFAYAATGEDTFRNKAEYIIGGLFSMQSSSKGHPTDFKTECEPTHAPQSLWPNGAGDLSALIHRISLRCLSSSPLMQPSGLPITRCTRFLRDFWTVMSFWESGMLSNAPEESATGFMKGSPHCRMNREPKCGRCILPESMAA